MSDIALMWVALAAPLAAVPAIVLLRNRPNAREFVSILAGFAVLAALLGLYAPVVEGVRPGVVIAPFLPGMPLALALEPLGLLFALVAAFLWPVTILYAIGYMRDHNERHQTRFYGCFALAIFASLAIAFAANLVTLFLFYELLTLATYPLVTHRGDANARRAGRKYLGYLLGTSIGLQLVAITWVWVLTGHGTFTPGGILAGYADPFAVSALLVLFVFGIGKLAIMPLHAWLPAAMVAPTPVSALLHAVAVVKAGAFTLIKVVLYVFGTELVAASAVQPWLLGVAGGTVILASLVALRQDNLKARLAFSTISQLSYIVIGALLATGWGILGAALHIATHAVGKITLFFCAGAILVTSHESQVSGLRNLGARMPFTLAVFAFAALSIIGLPPVAGLWSKWLLLNGAVQAGYPLLVGVLMLSSLLSLGYLLPIPLRGFFGARAGDSPSGEVHEASWPMLLAMGITASACLALFIYPRPLLRLVAPLAPGL